MSTRGLDSRLFVLLAALAVVCVWLAFSTAQGADVSCGTTTQPTIAFRTALPRTPMHVFDDGRTLWVALSGRHNPRTGATLAGGSIVAVDRHSGRILRRLRLPLDPTQFAAAFGSLWVIGGPISRQYSGVVRIDPGDGHVIAVIRASHAYGSRITATASAVWVGGADVFAQGHSDQAGVRFVYKINPRTNAVVLRVQLPQGTTVLDLHPEGSSLWVSGWWGVANISDSGRILFHAPFRGAGWTMAETPQAVWVTLPWSGTPYQRRQDPSHRTQQLLRIDRAGHQPSVTAINLPEQPGGVAAFGDTVWMGGSQGLARIDDTTTPPVVTPVGIDLDPTALFPFQGGVWVTEAAKNQVTKVIC